jgi:hypothetical protein
MEIAAKQFMVAALVSPFAMTTEFPQKQNRPLQQAVQSGSPLLSCVPASAVLFTPRH